MTLEIDGSLRHEVVMDLPAVHRHLDRHGEGWESMRDGVEAPDGWPLYLGRYQALTTQGSST